MNDSKRLMQIGFLATVVLGWSSVVSAQKPELIIEIDKREIYEGESILYRVTLNHVDKPKAPELKELKSLQITKLGEQSLDSRQITIINGQRSEVVRRGRQYNFQLTPLKSGTFTIPAPTATVDGVDLTGRDVTIRVVPPDDQDTVILEFTSDRSSVYPLQPFELTVTIAVQDLPGDLKDRDPLSVQSEPPALSVAWLTDNRLPGGVEPKENWREILEPLINRQGNGFQVNNIGSASAFSIFRNEATGFHPKPKQTIRKDAEGKDAGYWEYQFKRTLIPQKIGRLAFAPVTLKGTFAGGIENGRLTGRRIYARARGLEIQVKDVPLAGRPESYIGAVGSFDITSELTPTTARVGDPMTLTISVSGDGTLDDAHAPAIAKLDGVQNSFRTYDATEESKGNVRSFTYGLRPLSTDVTEFPPIPISYFDVESEEYVTRNTDPIALTIRKAEKVSDSEIISAPSKQATESGDLEASEGGVFANDSDFDSLQNESVSPGRWVGAWSVIVIGWFIASLGIGHVKRIREDPALQRRRSAASRARGALAEASSHLSTGDVTEVCESVRRAITGLIADVVNMPKAGMTPGDAAEQLASLDVDESLRTRTRELLDQCDAARYGAVADDATRLHQDAAGLIDELISATKTSSRNPSTIGTTVLLIGLAISGCGSKPDLETSRKFQEAEQSFGNAKTTDEFTRVAQQYRQIGGDEFVSGAALYNEGNAWMRAGETGRAIAAYRQAQRYRPRDPYLTANLQNALAVGGRSNEVGLDSGFAGYIFFWQNWLSYPEKFSITTILLLTTLIVSISGQLTSHRRLMRNTSIAVAFVCLLSAASAAWDWQRFDYTTHGVVIAESVIARMGNSESYEAAFTEPLSEGTEFVVIESRNEWIQIRIGDSGVGWLAEKDVQVY